MLTISFALALSVGLAGAPPAPPGATFPLDTAGTSRDFDKPPAGTPADQALWQSAYDLDNALVVEQHTAAKLAYAARTNLERLQDPAARGSVTEARAQELAAALTAKWTADVELMTATWPVSKVRGCRYELLNLEGLMIIGAAAEKDDGQSGEARSDLKRCLGQAAAVQSELRKANEDLAAAIAEAERALGPPRAPPKAAAAAAAEAPPKR